ncbi:ADP-heptose--LPS heptosyltransferase 2 [Anaerohalosphaera lusitana]|uniref:lipopolysaccharide heptosyltransferase II n=1 Tax=Anaerohalosphaera lusitana TaxID=1936003 RepID=A0A1U9NM11_9BACT|nr:lipopolysaccharide heptosyltransferase II [Anaerohalosphaera lusitana]AQT68949.1 ADP-heptose--LPS heptosyltransferase 2 [Anaerohalosphaera lusitana]
MSDKKQNILIWLPSPMGDAVLCTPALRALRRHFTNANITFLAAPTVRAVLSPSSFNDDWIDLAGGTLQLVRKLRNRRFDKAVLFKNSFGSAMTVYLAGIPERIGYTRDMRGLLLTKKITPARDTNGKFKPGSMVDYYLNLCDKLTCDITERSLELQVDNSAVPAMLTKLPAIVKSQGPLAILVPGGAFGPSKCWPTQRFAKLADILTEQHNATVIVSVAPNEAEQKIAAQICDKAETNIISLADISLSLGELKALIARSNVVVTNDTGPRHIAIALKRNVVSLFGPNNPEWTQTGYERETQIIGQAECVPCDEPVCKRPSHECMESITVDQVHSAVKEYLK